MTTITIKDIKTLTLDFETFHQMFYDYEDYHIAEKVWEQMLEDTSGEVEWENDAEEYDFKDGIDAIKDTAEENLNYQDENWEKKARKEHFKEAYAKAKADGDRAECDRLVSILLDDMEIDE